MIEHIEPKATADGVAVYCAHDKIVDTDSLVGNPRNPNNHPKEQITALAKIIKRQGWRHPIVVSNRSGFVVKGHGRLLAAKEIGAKQVPVDFQDYESEASEYADLMADNKIQEFSELDMKMSADILQDIKDSGDIELEMSAFTEEALNELLAKSQEGEVKEDDADLTPPENPVSEQGDIWLLGKHRLICGDSTKAETYENLMNGKKANLVVTDPPYNVDYASKNEYLNNTDRGNRIQTDIKNDNMSDADFTAFMGDIHASLYESCKPGAAIYVFHAALKAVPFITGFTGAGFLYKQHLVWVKNNIVIGKQDYQWQHEPILYGWKDGGPHYFINDRSQHTVIEDKVDFDAMTKKELLAYVKELQNDNEHPSTIIHEDKPMKNADHPTMKPVKLIGRLIRNSSRAFDLVIDFFLGSGSTLIAAHQLERNCFGIEISPQYCQIILDRIKKYDPEVVITKL